MICGVKCESDIFSDAADGDTNATPFDDGVCDNSNTRIEIGTVEYVAHANAKLANARARSVPIRCRES